MNLFSYSKYYSSIMNSHVKELISALSLMEENDITINTADNGVVKAPSYILKARSPVFRAMLNSDMKEAKTKVIDLKEFDTASVIEFVKYMKVAETPNGTTNVKLLVELNTLADQYALNELTKYTNEKLTSLATAMTHAFDILHYSANPGLKHSSIETIYNAIKTSSCDKKVSLDTIDEKIKVLIFDRIMTKSALTS